jgi:hypothetical protein
MGDTIRNDAAHWRQLTQAAILELDPAKLLERIADAQRAVLDRIEDGLTKPPDSEQLALRDALDSLRSLRRIAGRDIGE